MVKQYLKQALYMLKENRFVSVISIAGTAISIAMIMVVVLVFQVLCQLCCCEVCDVLAHVDILQGLGCLVDALAAEQTV